MTYERIRFGRMVDFQLWAPFPTEALEAETAAWVAEVISNGGTVSTPRRALVNDLIVSLKADGIWAKLDRLWLFAAENDESALTDLVGLTLATAVNSPTFAADEGYSGEDAANPTKYIDTNYNYSTATNLTQNSAHISYWNVTGGTPANGGAVLGANFGGFYNNELYGPFSDGNYYFRVNEAGSAAISAPAGSTGHFIGNRSGAAASEAYRNGSSFATPNTSSVAPQNIEAFVLATNQDGTAKQGTNKVIAAASFGGSLASGEASDFYTHLQTYMTAVGL